MSAKIKRIWPTRPNKAHIGQLRSRQTSPDRMWPKFGQHRPRVSKYRPHLDDVFRVLANIGQFGPTCCSLRATVWAHRSSSITILRCGICLNSQNPGDAQLSMCVHVRVRVRPFLRPVTWKSPEHHRSRQAIRRTWAQPATSWR